MERASTRSKDWPSTTLILKEALILLGRTSPLPDFSGMVTTYIYVLFGGMLFVVILAAARALGADFLHHEVVIDHGTDVGLNTHVETGTNDELQDASAGPSIKPGLVKFHGMTMMTVSIFLVSFAAMGILIMYYVVRPYNLDPLTSIPMSVVSSAVLTVGTSGSELGEVRCDVKGQIMSMSARSTDGSRICVGDEAQIMGMTGNIAVI